MKRIAPAHDAGPAAEDDAWLRTALHDDLARADYLEDDGFSVRIVRALPPPQVQLPWLDVLSVLLVSLVFAVALWPVLAGWGDALAAALPSAGDWLSSRLPPAAAQVWWSLLGTLAPVAALALAAILFADA